MSARDRFDVVVSGGGAAGAATALALAGQGFDVALIEPRPPAPLKPELDARVVALSQSSLRFLQRIALWPMADVYACPYRAMEVRAGAEQLTFTPGLIHSPDLGSIVDLAALQALAFAQVRERLPVYDTALASMDAGTREARIELADGRRLRAHLVVAAEGARSPLRQAAGIAVRGHAYACSALIAHLQTDQVNPGIAFQRFLPGGPLAFLPLRGGASSLVFTRPQDQIAEWLALPEQDFRDRLFDASEGRFGRVLAHAAPQAWPLNLQLAESMVAARLALVGDAAHQVHPLAGLGLNLGLIDAAALVDVLVAARNNQRDLGSASTLSRYDSWRRSDTHLVARVVDLIEYGFSGRAGRVGSLLPRALGMVDQVDALKRFFALAAAGRIGRVPSMAAA